MPSTWPNSTILSANNRNVHAPLPSGASVQAIAIKQASFSPSNNRGLAFKGVRRDGADYKLSSTNFCRTLSIVLTLISSASLSSLSLNPPFSWFMSAFSRIRAWLTLYAGDFPLVVILSNSFLSSCSRATMYFFWRCLIRVWNRILHTSRNQCESMF